MGELWKQSKVQGYLSKKTTFCKQGLIQRAANTVRSSTAVLFPLLLLLEFPRNRNAFNPKNPPRISFVTQDLSLLNSTQRENKQLYLNCKVEREEKEMGCRNREFLGQESSAAPSSLNDALLFTTMCIIGLPVDVHVKDGSIYSGIFHTAYVENDYGTLAVFPLDVIPFCESVIFFLNQFLGFVWLVELYLDFVYFMMLYMGFEYLDLFGAGFLILDWICLLSDWILLFPTLDGLERA